MTTKVERPVPVNSETVFQMDQLLFSSTDLNGNISTSNDFFVSLSQYDKEELIGFPHNIVRHPDMPQIIFKLLWEHIQAGKIIATYIKNMTKDGKYYWILSTTCTIPEGYCSIGCKPSSEYFQFIPDLYKELLEVEQTGDVEESRELLLKTLQAKGFHSYGDFMSRVLISEFNERYDFIQERNAKLQEDREGEVDIIKDTSSDYLSGGISTVKNLSDGVMDVFNDLSEDLDNVLRIENVLNVNSTSMLDFSESISILSLNADIESFRIGKNGLTLSVISKEIKKKSDIIEFNTSKIVNYVKEISSQSQKIGLYVAASRLQAEMTNFFSLQTLEKIKQGTTQEEGFKDSEENILALTKLFVKTFSKLVNVLKPLIGQITEILNLIKSINKIISDLEKSNVVGNIEASRIGIQGKKFNIVFNQIRESTDETNAKLTKLYKYLTNVISIVIVVEGLKKDMSSYEKKVKATFNK